MITVSFLTPSGGPVVGFRIAGHAGCGEAGQDIVCAAVSSAAYLVANTITEILSVTPRTLEVGEGEMRLEVGERDEPLCRVLFSGLRLHLSGLAEEYPQAVNVTFEEGKAFLC